MKNDSLERNVDTGSYSKAFSLRHFKAISLSTTDSHWSQGKKSREAKSLSDLNPNRACKKYRVSACYVFTFLLRSTTLFLIPFWLFARYRVVFTVEIHTFLEGFIEAECLTNADYYYKARSRNLKERTNSCYRTVPFCDQVFRTEEERKYNIV